MNGAFKMGFGRLVSNGSDDSPNALKKSNPDEIDNVAVRESPRSPPGAQRTRVSSTSFRSKSMATDPKKSVPPSAISSDAKTDVDHSLLTGLAEFSVRELFGMLITSPGSSESNVYCQDTPSDSSNGF